MSFMTFFKDDDKYSKVTFEAKARDYLHRGFSNFVTSYFTVHFRLTKFDKMCWFDIREQVKFKDSYLKNPKKMQRMALFTTIFEDEFNSFPEQKEEWMRCAAYAMNLADRIMYNICSEEDKSKKVKITLDEVQTMFKEHMIGVTKYFFGNSYSDISSKELQYSNCKEELYKIATEQLLLYVKKSASKDEIADAIFAHMHYN
jgi:hypothetical protein